MEARKDAPDMYSHLPQNYSTRKNSINGILSILGGGGGERANNPVISSTLQEEEGIMVEGFRP
jgi:hypothetical protein